ncbi:MAG: hypothetical protein M5U31_07855 [Acidimicrobiia bacterium]|nr:hypothetical protein [Acidimicrobiia bacterium]
MGQGIVCKGAEPVLVILALALVALAVVGCWQLVGYAVGYARDRRRESRRRREIDILESLYESTTDD